jgi:hypothetical protein
MDTDERLVRVRQGMRVFDPEGRVIGTVREVSGKSLLIHPVFGQRVFWIGAADIESVDGREVRLRLPVTSA